MLMKKANIKQQLLILTLQLRANNNDPEFYVLRAKANYKIDNKDLAINDLNKSIRH